jgi:excisionase family DNA binding protein
MSQQQATQLLTTRQVAEWLGVHDETVRRWVKAGVLRSVRLGGAVRFERSEVDRMIEEAKGDA